MDVCSKKFDQILSNSKLLLIRGFIFTSEKDFLIERYRANLRQFFTPPVVYEEKIQEPLEKLKEACDIVVGVVIRHGDYREYRSGEYFYSLSVFRRLLMECAEFMKPSISGFFIASDEDQDTVLFEDFPFYFRQGHPVENLNALCRCDYLMGTPSTFLTWPSFFGNIPCFQLFPKDLEQEKLPFPPEFSK